MGLEEIYTELVSEHSRSPEHRHALPGATCSLKGHNPSCGDEITLQLKVKDGVVEDAAFTGVGCAISQASTDMMVDLIRGKRVEEARALAQKFIGMIKGESHMPARVKCAVLAWHTLDEALKDEK